VGTDGYRSSVSMLEVSSSELIVSLTDRDEDGWS